MCKRLLVTALVLLFSRSIAAADFGPAVIAPAAVPINATLGEVALWGNTLQVFARYQLGDPAAPFLQTDVMSDAGVTSIDKGLPILDYSSRATQNRQQVEQAVRLNIAEFIDRLEAFTATQADRTAAR